MELIFLVVCFFLGVKAIDVLFGSNKPAAHGIALALADGDESKLKIRSLRVMHVSLDSAELYVSLDVSYHLNMEIVWPLEQWPYFLSFDSDIDRFTLYCGKERWELPWLKWAECFGGETLSLEPSVLSTMRVKGKGSGAAARGVMMLDWSLESKAASPDHVAKKSLEAFAQYRGLAVQLQRWFSSPAGLERVSTLAQDVAQELGLRRLCLAILAASASDATASPVNIDAILDELWSRGELSLCVVAGLDEARVAGLSDDKLEQMLAYLVEQPAPVQDEIGVLLAGRVTPEQLVRVANRSAYLRLVIVLTWREKKLQDEAVICAALVALVAGLNQEQLRKLLALVLVWHGPDWTGLMEQLRLVSLDRESVGLLIRLVERHYAFRPKATLSDLMVRALINAMRRADGAQLNKLEHMLISRGTVSSSQIIRDELSRGAWMHAEVEQTCMTVLSALSQRLGLRANEGGLTLFGDDGERAGALSQVDGEQGSLNIVD